MDRRLASGPGLRLALCWIAVLAVMGSVLSAYAVDRLGLAFFTHDAEAELLAVRSIVDSSFTSVSIPWTRAYPADHEELLPFGPNFLAVHEHRLYPSRPLLYLLLAAMAYRVAGVAGLYVLPALAAVVAVHLAYRLATRFEARPGLPQAVWTIPVLALATPILFYGLCVWSMILGGTLSTAAVWLVLGRRGLATALLGGVLIGVGAGMRPELSLLVFPLLPWAWRQTGPRRAAGLAAGILGVGMAIAALNHVVFGSWLGPHIAGNEISPTAWLTSRPGVAHALLLQSRGGAWIEAVSAVACLLALLPSSAPWPGPRLRAMFLWIFAAGSAWVTVATFRSPDPFSASLRTHSLLACAPLLFFALFFRAGEDSRLRALRWLGLAYLTLTCLFCPPQAAHAAHWGPRILLGFLPVVGVLAWTACTEFLSAFRGPWIRPAIGVLLALSLANQAYGVRILLFKKHETAVFQSQMDRNDLPLVSDDWIVPADLASWYPRRALWYPRSAEDVELVFENLRREGRTRMLVVARDGSPLDRYLRGLAASGRLRAGPRDPIESRLFHYRGMSATTYETVR